MDGRDLLVNAASLAVGAGLAMSPAWPVAAAASQSAPRTRVQRSFLRLTSNSIRVPRKGSL